MTAERMLSSPQQQCLRQAGLQLTHPIPILPPPNFMQVTGTPCSSRVSPPSSLVRPWKEQSKEHRPVDAEVQIKVVRGRGGLGEHGKWVRSHVQLMGRWAQEAHPPPNPSSSHRHNLEGPMGSKRGHRRGRRAAVGLE